MVEIPIGEMFAWVDWPEPREPIDRAGWRTFGQFGEADEWHNLSPSGFIELVLRTGHGNLCGYVGVPRYSKFYQVVKYGGEGIDANVHGGITFSGTKSDYPGFWFIGFDCAHSGDVIPGMPSFGDGTYRTMEYTKIEVASLLQQILGLSCGD